MFAQNNKRELFPTRGTPVFLFLEAVFYAQNVKGEPRVAPTQPPPTLQEAAQLGLDVSLQDKVRGPGQLRPLST